ncbi:hypothetical protein [Parvibaculum sp.]|uniref:hypothetical protein n=1 Tax=Parvibaculum sp. TaxID=2024848 RepID=UPI001B2B81FE|nr:hypothetical protein [Parvibaculum sp.]MBO6679457.1 hypothetical protein [Parvibaculum sp.]MBO6685617.1 hypothetical protein [Parvibaculum sp.]MBO6905888.1 hypothetical protein [Parvibaculum sp.]
MKKVSAFAGLVLLGLLSCLSWAAAQPALDDPEEFLTGFWATGEEPPGGRCDTRPDGASLVQFDFGAAGGRMITYNSFDAFMFGPLTVEKTGEATLLLAESGRTEEVAAPSTLRVLSDDSFEFASDEAAPVIFHRCDMQVEEYEPSPPHEPELAPRPVPDPS